MRDQFTSIFGARRGLGLSSRFHSEDFPSVLQHTQDEVALAICNDDLPRANLKRALAWLRHSENEDDVHFRRSLVKEMLYLVLVEEYSLGAEAWLRASNPDNSNIRAQRVGVFGWSRRDELDELNAEEREEYEQTVAKLQDEATSALLADTAFTEGRRPKTDAVIAMMRSELRDSIARTFADFFAYRDAPKLLFTPQQLDSLWEEHGIDRAWRPLGDAQVWRPMIDEAERAAFQRYDMSPQQRQRARRRLLDVVYSAVSERLAASPSG